MKKKAIATLTVAALLTTGLLLDSRYNIDITEYSLEFESLPAEFEGFKSPFSPTCMAGASVRTTPVLQSLSGILNPTLLLYAATW